ncbi:tRNA (adenine-N(1)-)-methyltransferase non-catalytic subunit TRM6 [Echinococcus granulosus]|uniref:tRNA (adenine(58)-N(1))-methyltransferase non-catalytic subunit TRM6 n=1 Tax=Echinococcus granulosus TaxID=6210 RepID=W6UT63_ECHGR|nr:tRNA (adenine-N(1)-)-methyltransferase non-catalytic subunit TRM6 [Echinococcus granulosus]EUB56579.1 tRNA (adenine-N(1)-)-methyltransferase non-catalytic subunit TRM6 [Echinococcus granulosus]
MVSQLSSAMWKSIEVGNKVIVQKCDSYQVLEVRPNVHIDVGKIKVPASAIIGYPMGSTFYFDGTSVTQVKADEITLETVDVESSKDNRHLLDRSENQLLTADDIQSLKSTGSTGNAIISKLVEKCTTFRLKTKFSQEKYLRKKKKSYLCVFTVRPHTARNIADMQMCCKATSLRYDSLVQLLTFANVHAGCTVLLTDTYSGLVTKAVLERLGHRSLGGRLITFFHGTSPPIVDVALAQASPPRPRIEEEEAAAEACLVTNEDKSPSDELCLFGTKEALPETAADSTRKSRRVSQRRSKKTESMSEEEKLKRSQEKQEQLNEIRRILCPTDEQLSPDLEDRPDCLIVASRFYPVEITLLLMQFLPPGRPFVVHSHILPALVDLYNVLKRRGSCAQLSLHDTWLRPMQVLPGRTHPVIRMTSGGGGFILHGYTVQRREDPDAFLSRSTMRASTKQLFDEGLISYAQ